MGSQIDRGKTVVHVLPHPGGGGETYLDLLSRMEGYRFERVTLLPQARRGRVADALRLLPRAGYAVLRPGDLFHVHGEIAAAAMLAALAVRPSVVTLHGLHVLRRSSGAKRRAAEANLRLVLRAATRSICVAEAERDELLEVAGPGIEPRLAVIHNGVDVVRRVSEEERAAARAAYGLPPGATIGVFVGGLDKHKDPQAAARAAVEVARGGAPLVLLIAGSGPALGELERLAEAAGGGVLRLLGHEAQLRPVLAAADFFVLPSWREGFSFSLLEAMSFGLAPVVSDAPGNPEAVGDAGIVVGRGDVAGYAAAFRRLLGNPVERLELGERARERVAERFTAEAMVSKTRALYGEVLALGGWGSRRAAGRTTGAEIASPGSSGGPAHSGRAAEAP